MRSNTECSYILIRLKVYTTLMYRRFQSLLMRRQLIRHGLSHTWCVGYKNMRRTHWPLLRMQSRQTNKKEWVYQTVLTFLPMGINSSQFAKYGDQPFSISVFDVFCNLHQGYELVKRLHCSDMQLCYSYLYRYAKVVHVVICHYIKQIEVELRNKEGTNTAMV